MKKSFILGEQFHKYNQPFPVGVKLPVIHIDHKYYQQLNLDDRVSNKEFLTLLCNRELDIYLAKHNLDAENYRKRLEYELYTLDELGFIDYILLNWDILNYCHEHDIPTGFGRGSAAGSLVLFLIKVTKLDPIKHELFFERFVSASRARKIEHDGEIFLDGSLLCDIDNDISYDRRQDVIAYIESKFEGYTCKILTLNTLSGKLCIKESYKIVSDASEDEANTVSDMIPKKFGKVFKLEKAYEESEEFREFCDKHERVYNIAKKLEGLNKNTGVHPSGIGISYYKISDIMPMQLTNDGHLVSGYDMNGVSELMVKFDILGLRTLTVVDNTCKQLGIKMEDIDPSHFSIFAGLQELDFPRGLFQIEADTNFKICKQVKPRNLEHLSAVVAIARPGALDFADDYAKYVATGEFQSVHEFFDDILSITGGIPLYQEQLMRMANKIGFTLDESEQLRRIVGKKKVEQAKEWEEKINKKIEENNLDPEIGKLLWHIIEASANYSFNKSHSAAYSMLSAITAYLKFNHPLEFFISLLNMTRHEQDSFAEINIISQELNAYGIKLLPPDLARSKADFSIDGNNIRYGLTSIRGVSEKTLESLLLFCEEKLDNFYDVLLSAKSAGLNIGTVCALIQAGALDSMVEDRCKGVLWACSFNILTDRVKRNIVALGPEFLYDPLTTIHRCVKDSLVGDDGRKIFTDSTFATFKKNYEPYKEIYNQNKKHEKFANWYFERRILGYAHSDCLRNVFEEKDFTPIIELKEKPKYSRIKIVGTITNVYSGVSRNGNKYYRYTVSDETASIMCILMNNRRRLTLDNYLAKGNELPVENNIITVSGSTADDAIFIDDLDILDYRIYMKLSDLQ